MDLVRSAAACGHGMVSRFNRAVATRPAVIYGLAPGAGFSVADEWFPHVIRGSDGDHAIDVFHLKWIPEHIPVICFLGDLVEGVQAFCDKPSRAVILLYRFTRGHIGARYRCLCAIAEFVELVIGRNPEIVTGRIGDFLAQDAGNGVISKTGMTGDRWLACP